MSTNVLVEFAGPPAAGKTTLSRMVATCLESNTLDVREPSYTIGQQSRPHRIATKTRYMVERLFRNPSLSFSDLYTIYSSQKHIRDVLRLGFNWQYLCGLTHHTAGDVTLLDQGLFQALWSIGYRSRRDWEDALRMLTVPDSAVPDLVVIVRADENTLQTRLGTDHDSTTRVSERRAEIRRSIDGIKHLQDLIEEYDIKSIEVDNTSEAALQRAIESVSDQIRYIYEQQV